MRIIDYGKSPTPNGFTSLIFPMYNPGPAIEQTWYDVQQFVRDAPGKWELLFVCDGCTDDSPALLQKLTDDVPEQVRLIHFDKNRGKGFGVRTGLREAKGTYRIFTDVDLSYGLDGVLRVAEKLWAGQDVVVGSRLLPDSSFVIPARLQDYAYYRRIQSAVFSTMVRRLLPLRQTDVQAGLKGLHAAAASAILPHLDCEGFSFDCQLLLICKHFGFDIVEVPIQFVYHDEFSTTNFRKSIRMVRDLIQMRSWFRRFQKTPKPEQPAAATRKIAGSA